LHPAKPGKSEKFKEEEKDEEYKKVTDIMDFLRKASRKN